MTSSNGNIFRVTGPLCGEFTGPGEFPTQRPVTRSFDVFFDLRLNKRLSKQPWGWWFETPSWSLWRQCNEYDYNSSQGHHPLNRHLEHISSWHQSITLQSTRHGSNHAQIPQWVIVHYSDVVWAPKRLKSSTDRLFAQQVFRPTNIENIKDPHDWRFVSWPVDSPPDYRWIPPKKASDAENVITLSS